MAHVSQEKKELVKKISGLLAQYPIVGAVNMENLPAPQLQAMKAKLRGKIELVMTKRRLMNIAIENAKAKVSKLEKIAPFLKGTPALLAVRIGLCVRQIFGDCFSGHGHAIAVKKPGVQKHFHKRR